MPKKLRKVTMTMQSSVDSYPAVRLQRTYAAPPERVFRAWLDADLVAQWMLPGPVDSVQVEIDPHQGGRYRVWHSGGGVALGGFDARILEIDPPRRLVFAWGFVGPDPDHDPRFDSRLTVVVDADPAGARLTLVHEQLDSLAAGLPAVAEQVEAGWSDVLGKLVEVVR